MTYLVTAALVTCAVCLALTLDGVIADHWHMVGYVRGYLSSDAYLQWGVHRNAHLQSHRVGRRCAQVEIGTTCVLMNSGR